MATATIHKLTSEKGRIVLAYEVYNYTLERKTNVKLIFRCQSRDCRDKIINIINEAKVFGKMLSCIAWSFQ